MDPIFYYDKITEFEKLKLTEEQIIDKCIEMLYESDATIERMYDINDALSWKGYSYQFSVKKETKKAFNFDEYTSIVSQASKSKAKTYELIKYLASYDDWRLSLNSLHFITLSKLMELGVLPASEEVKALIGKMNLYDFYMSMFSPEKEGLKDIKEKIEEWLETIGLEFLRMDYMQFRMSLEYLLWTITKNDKAKDAYLKINSIKVALSICPREYLCFNGKEYYNKKMHKNLVKYLSLIDKAEIKRIKDKYKTYSKNDSDTGYKLLFNMI